MNHSCQLQKAIDTFKNAALKNMPAEARVAYDGANAARFGERSEIMQTAKSITKPAAKIAADQSSMQAAAMLELERKAKFERDQKAKIESEAFWRTPEAAIFLSLPDSEKKRELKRLIGINRLYGGRSIGEVMEKVVRNLGLPSRKK